MSFEYNWTPAGDPKEQQIVYEARLGFRKYQLESGGREQTEQWLKEIEQLEQAISGHNLEQLEELMKGRRYKRDVRKIMQIQEADNLDDEGKKLLAISLWIMRGQSDWRGFLAAGFKLIKGGLKKFTDYFGEAEAPSCLDAAVLVEFFTEQLKIEGVIKRLAGRYTHWYWESNSGKVVDIWWGYNRGGVYNKKEIYENVQSRYTRSGRLSDQTKKTIQNNDH